VEQLCADSALAEAEVIMMAAEMLAASGISFSLHVGHLAFMRSLLTGLEPDDQKKARMFLDKKDKLGLEGYLGSIGQEDLAFSLTSLAGCRDLPSAFSLTGNIPEKDRICELFSILDSSGTAYELDPGIARGLDYYSGMVFEAYAGNLGAENQVLGGGTYRLAHLFGGEETPSCGFAIGFDRVMVSRGERSRPADSVVGVASTPEGLEYALAVASRFREAGLRTELALSGKSLGQQISTIARSADFALIIGKKESDEGMVTLKDLRSGAQKILALDDAIAEVRGSEPR
jgi:histidyl-tRNA synthetase